VTGQKGPLIRAWRCNLNPRSVRHHEDLLVWQRGIALAKDVYEFTARLPKDERFGLTAQIRRCVVSVPVNIAEGAARGGTREFCRYIAIAQGSLAELDTHLVLARELHGLQMPDSLIDQMISLRRMLIRLRNALASKRVT
jgi:four helix bundle protein